MAIHGPYGLLIDELWFMIYLLNMVMSAVSNDQRECSHRKTSRLLSCSVAFHGILNGGLAGESPNRGLEWEHHLSVNEGFSRFFQQAKFNHVWLPTGYLIFRGTGLNQKVNTGEIHHLSLVSTKVAMIYIGKTLNNLKHAWPWPSETSQFFSSKTDHPF